MSAYDDERADRIAERERLAAILNRHAERWAARGRVDIHDALADLSRSVEECDDAGNPPPTRECPKCGPNAPKDGDRCDTCREYLGEAVCL